MCISMHDVIEQAAERESIFFNILEESYHILRVIIFMTVI